jgi:hypothetical protein
VNSDYFPDAYRIAAERASEGADHFAREILRPPLARLLVASGQKAKTERRGKRRAPLPAPDSPFAPQPPRPRAPTVFSYLLRDAAVMFLGWRRLFERRAAPAPAAAAALAAAAPAPPELAGGPELAAAAARFLGAMVERGQRRRRRRPRRRDLLSTTPWSPRPPP